MKKPELLAPAGNMEKLKMALLYGADAVYLGGKAFGLRAFGGNFSREELGEAVAFAHNLGKKVYVTVNIFPHNSDIEALPDYLGYLNSIRVDGILVADLGVFTLAKQFAPDVELHISTQANNTNWAAVNAWADMGADRVVLARHVHFLFRPLPDEQLSDRPGCQPGQLRPALPLELCPDGGKEAGAVFSCTGG